MYLEIKDVVKQYTNHRALDGVSLAVPRGGVYGLLGPNGAGKTTLIRIINQITAPDSGSVTLNGKPLVPSDIARIGYLPEERGLYKKMRVGEQILFLAQLKGVSKNDARIRMQQWLDKFEISTWSNKKIEELSKGMQQKIQFITTVIHQPELLIFDEPFSGFDPVNANLLKREIAELQKGGATVIFSTHNMSSVEELCNEITLINHSKVVLQGKVADIKEQHKRNILRIALTDNQPIAPSLMYVVLEEQVIDEQRMCLLRKNSKVKNSEIITDLAKNHELRLFEELLPSMNEIFIDTVGESNHAKLD